MAPLYKNTLSYYVNSNVYCTPVRLATQASVHHADINVLVVSAVECI